jgi:uncharacterized membrane protein YbaN (DUF454 family)
MDQGEHRNEIKLLPSRPARLFLVGLGSVFVGLGAVGAFLPVLPTTPFLLLAAACYARASARFHRWLLSSRIFGPTIAEWQRHRSIARRTKIMAIALLTVTIATSVVFFVKQDLARAVLILTGAGVIVFLLRVPSRDGDQASKAPVDSSTDLGPRRNSDRASGG